MAVAEVKTLLTVPEAAKALRIGRSTAYDLAHAWLDSGGTRGLPVIAIGGSLRVPVAALERLFAIGGFGPAWQSGLDGRRSASRTEPAGGGNTAPTPSSEPREADDAAPVVASDLSEPVVADDAPLVSTAASERAATRTRKPRTQRRPPINPSVQLSLFGNPEP